jgi:predicted Zn-dependent protease
MRSTVGLVFVVLVSGILLANLLGCQQIAAVPRPQSVAPAAPETLAKLMAAADEVLKLDSVQARPRINVVFELADALKNAGQDKEAMRYYEAGLKCNPWAMQHHLSYAQLLEKNGLKAQAATQAKIVLDLAGDDELVAQARKIVDSLKAPDTEAQPLAKPALIDFAVVLVTMGDVDVSMLKDLCPRLEAELGFPVVLWLSNLKMPAPSREPLREFLKPLREKMLERGTDRYADLFTELNMTPDDLRKDTQFLAFYRALVFKTRGAAVQREFDLASPDPDPQWNAEELIGLLTAAVRLFEREKVRFVGVTNLDIYSEGSNFLFGLRIGNYGVFSYRRFDAPFTGEAPDRQRLLDRATKQALASIGNVFGMQRCTNPRCARAYPNSLRDHDAKLPQLCDQCKAALRKLVGWQPTATSDRKGETPG